MLARTARHPATWGELPSAAASAVALLDGRFTDEGAAACAQRAQLALGEEPAAQAGDAFDSLFRDPYLDAAPDPRLAVVLVRDARDAASLQAADSGEVAEAVVAAARASGVRVSEAQASPGHPLERLADLVSLVDFTATYLAIGGGLDPSVSDHVAALRQRRSTPPAPS